MPKENIKKELLVYISKLDGNEQADLLEAIKNRELLKQAIQLDSEQREHNKAQKLPTMQQIVKTIETVRNQHAKKAA